MLFEDFHSENFCEVHICHGKYVAKFCKKYPPSRRSQKNKKKRGKMANKLFTTGQKWNMRFSSWRDLH